jgi:hypothetical protein
MCKIKCVCCSYILSVRVCVYVFPTPQVRECVLCVYVYIYVVLTTQVCELKCVCVFMCVCVCLCGCMCSASITCAVLVLSCRSLKNMIRVGQDRIYTPYMTVYLVISLPKIPWIHRIYMVLANPKHDRNHTFLSVSVGITMYL